MESRLTLNVFCFNIITDGKHGRPSSRHDSSIITRFIHKPPYFTNGHYTVEPLTPPIGLHRSIP